MLILFKIWICCKLFWIIYIYWFTRLSFLNDSNFCIFNGLIFFTLFNRLSFGVCALILYYWSYYYWVLSIILFNPYNFWLVSSFISLLILRSSASVLCNVPPDVKLISFTKLLLVLMSSLLNTDEFGYSIISEQFVCSSEMLLFILSIIIIGLPFNEWYFCILYIIINIIIFYK